MTDPGDRHAPVSVIVMGGIRTRGLRVARLLQHAAAQKIFGSDLERNFGNRLFLGV